jgi:hypothetical protein
VVKLADHGFIVARSGGHGTSEPDKPAEMTDAERFAAALLDEPDFVIVSHTHEHIRSVNGGGFRAVLNEATGFWEAREDIPAHSHTPL